MENNHEQTAPFGFISEDGCFQAISGLTTHSLEYVSKTSAELQQLLEMNIASESYETCAVIRDVIRLRGI